PSRPRRSLFPYTTLFRSWRWVRISISSDLVMGSCRAWNPRDGRPGSPGPPPTLNLLGLVPELLTQQRAELGGSGRGIRGAVVLRQRLLGLGLVLGLDGQLHQAALAIGADDLGLDFVADLELLAGVLDPLVRAVVDRQVAFHSVAQVDGRALGVHCLDGALHDRAAAVVGLELAHRVLLQLLHAEADALALRVDRQDNGLEGVALLVVADDFLGVGVPADVRQVHQAVDAAFQADEDAEVGDRLDLALDLVALLVDRGE